MRLLLFVMILVGTTWAHAKIFERRLKCLTTTNPTRDFGDPSTPDFSNPEAVRVYTTGGDILSWKQTLTQSAAERFFAGAPPDLDRLSVYHDDGTTPLDDLDAGEDIWDPSIQHFSGAPNPILFGAVMSRRAGAPNALWPDDHWSRRTFAFYKVKNRWVRASESVFGPVPTEPEWLGHNYGHHFITDTKKQVWMFYERVSEVVNGRPDATELFARKYKNEKLYGSEITILDIPHKPWPRAVRDDGARLIEGPRPFKVGDTYFVSFSAGDYNSSRYGIHLAWSKKITGPFTPLLTPNKKDLLDLGAEIRKHEHLTWGPGRAAFFSYNNCWWVVFHAATANDSAASPDRKRALYLAPVELSLPKHGEPTVTILTQSDSSC